MMRQMRRYPRGRYAWRIGALFCALAVLFVVAACSSGTSGQGGSSTATPLTTQNCGSLHSTVAGLLQADKAVAQQDETCFYQAYKQCHPATLTYQAASLDTGAIHHFSITARSGSCTLTDGFQHYIAPNPPGGAITYTCAAVQMQSDGLHITACGNAGDVVIPVQ
ncbi:MAG TPA: hypothetical protein VGT44_20620 [Ktedonobacteraceae bacterium]|nr:hypothetical protein [Ktedonobacteraceae bacterium]